MTDLVHKTIFIDWQIRITYRRQNGGAKETQTSIHLSLIRRPLPAPRRGRGVGGTWGWRFGYGGVGWVGGWRRPRRELQSPTRTDPAGWNGAGPLLLISRRCCSTADTIDWTSLLFLMAISPNHLQIIPASFLLALRVSLPLAFAIFFNNSMHGSYLRRWFIQIFIDYSNLMARSKLNLGWYDYFELQSLNQYRYFMFTRIEV